VLGVPEQNIWVIAPDMGGGFGNRTDVAPETVIACIMAMRLNRPVKWSESRSESMQASMHGRGQTDIVEAAVTNEGKITGLKVMAICDIGAYNQYLWPRIITTDPENWGTAPIAVQSLSSNPENANLIVAGSLVVALPMVVLLILFQRQIISGLTAGAVKG